MLERGRNALTRATAVPGSLVRDIAWRYADSGDREPIVTGPFAVDEALQTHWREHGWVVLKSDVAATAIDRLNAEVERFRRRTGGPTDDSGHGFRIGLLHAVNRQSLKLALNPHAMEFLRWAFAGEPILFGSLTFDVGSEQEAHIDAAFFHTEPDDAMAGVWTALEDIHPDSGPLFYVDRSHAFPRLLANEVLAADPALAERVAAFRRSGRKVDYALSEDVYRAYSAHLRDRLERARAERVPVVMRKGDVFIWHGWLVHGGLPRRDRELTRRSMVVHFIRDGARFWDQHAFFLRGDQLATAAPVRFSYRSCSRGRYVKHHREVRFHGGDGHYRA